MKEAVDALLLVLVLLLLVLLLLLASVLCIGVYVLVGLLSRLKATREQEAHQSQVHGRNNPAGAGSFLDQQKDDHCKTRHTCNTACLYV